MKVKRIHRLTAVSLAFAIFILGLFAVRNFGRSHRNSLTLRSQETVSVATAPVQSESAATEVTLPSGPININTATAELLETLPGIGPVLALNIIDYRDANGPFTTIGQLMEVSGIGEKRMEAIWDLVTIEGE